MAELTLTMCVRLSPTRRQADALAALCSTFADCCNDVADYVDSTHTLSQKKINKAIYHQLRETHGLLAQMTQSAIRRVIANYKAIHTRIANLREESKGKKNGKRRKRRKIPAYYSIKPQYAPDGADLLWNRDYSYSTKTGLFSLPVMDGRIKVKAEWASIPDHTGMGVRNRTPHPQAGQMASAHPRHHPNAGCHGTSEDHRRHRPGYPVPCYLLRRGAHRFLRWEGGETPARQIQGTPQTVATQGHAQREKTSQSHRQSRKPLDDRHQPSGL